MHWWPLKPCFLIGGLRSIQTIMRLLIAQCRPLSATFLFRTAGFSQWNWLYQAQRKVRVNGPVDWPDALMAPMKPFFLIGGLTSTPGTLTGGIPATLAPAMASEVWVAIVLFRFSSPASLTTFVQLVGWVTKNQLSKDFKHEDRSLTTRSYITNFLFFLKNASFVKRLINHSNFFQTICQCQKRWPAKYWSLERIFYSEVPSHVLLRMLFLFVIFSKFVFVTIAHLIHPCFQVEFLPLFLTEVGTELEREIHPGTPTPTTHPSPMWSGFSENISSNTLSWNTQGVQYFAFL